MPPPDTESLRAAFAGPAEMTIGVEEELMLLDPETLDLAPVASEALARLEGDPRFKDELPAAQIELVTEPAATVAEAEAMLGAARGDLAAATEGLALPAGAGAHPFAAALGELSGADRYAFTRAQYGSVAARQLVFGLHVHVRVAGVERAVAVYNALRSHLPELAALGSNAPFHEGVDSGLASVRPLISGLLPRQGVPPALSGIDELAAALRFGARAGTFPAPRTWWWELRLHPFLGTVEVRVPDQQTLAIDSAAVAAVVHALVAQLAARHDAGEELSVHPSWRIAENRWLAARHGLTGTLADLDTGAPQPARERLTELIDSLSGSGEALGCAPELRRARDLAERNGAERQRVAADDGGPRGLAGWLADRFLAA
jgi:carboxylate-amine ligase